MIDKKKFYINGEWIDAKGKESIKVIDPSTEKCCAELSLGSNEDGDSAVIAA